MTELSLAAQVVLDAVKEISPAPADEIAAASIRAAAVEIVLPKYQYADWKMADLIMQELLTIAEELENQ